MYKIRVGGVPEHFNWPWHLAFADHAFAASATDVSFSDYPGGTGAMIEALGSGKLDLALLLTEGALAGALNGANYKLVKVYVSSPLTWGIHVAQHSDLSSMRNAAGRRIAISRYGSGSHLIAIVDALARGLPIDNLQFVVVGDLAGARRALAADEADIFLWERFTTNPLVVAGEFRRIDQCVVPWPAFTAVVRDDLLPEHDASIRHLLETVHRYSSRLKRRRHAVREIADAYRLQHDDAAQWFRDVRWTASFKRPNRALRSCAQALARCGILANDASDAASVWHQL